MGELITRCPHGTYIVENACVKCLKDKERKTSCPRCKELEEENIRLRAIIDARLCTEHANSIGLYGYEEGDNTTPKGGGCAVCIGIKLEQENARLRAAVEWATDLLWNSKVTFRPNHMADTERENCVCIVCDETAFAYEIRRRAGLPPREGEEG